MNETRMYYSSSPPKQSPHKKGDARDDGRRKYNEKMNVFLEAKNPQNVETNDFELRDEAWKTKTHTPHPA